MRERTKKDFETTNFEGKRRFFKENYRKIIGNTKCYIK